MYMRVPCIMHVGKNGQNSGTKSIPWTVPTNQDPVPDCTCMASATRYSLKSPLSDQYMHCFRHVHACTTQNACGKKGTKLRRFLNRLYLLVYSCMVFLFSSFVEPYKTHTESKQTQENKRPVSNCLALFEVLVQRFVGFWENDVRPWHFQARRIGGPRRG